MILIAAALLLTCCGSTESGSPDQRDTGTETDSNTDDDTGSEPDTFSDDSSSPDTATVGGDSDSETDIDVDSDSDTDSDTDSDSDTDTDSDSDTGSDSNSDVDSDSATSDRCTDSPEPLCQNSVLTHCDYVYEYWKEQGTGCMTSDANGGFSVSWEDDISDILFRKGLRPGSTDLPVTYEADFQPNGNAYLGVYGWMQNPLAEYYIVEGWGSSRPPGDDSPRGTVVSDGGTYNIYFLPIRRNSIDTAYNTYWSVRGEKRTSETVTLANHFNAWAELDVALGQLYEVMMVVDGYQSSGTAAVTTLSMTPAR